MKPRTVDLARGKWRGILMALGIEETYLTGKHGPCPVCEGRDRFRWDNKDGSGSFICSVCGSGSGFDLLKAVKGWDFRTAAAEVDKVIGNVEREPEVKRIDPEVRVEMLNRLWLSGSPVSQDDPAGRYLAARGVTIPSRQCLRYVERCPVPGGGYAPAMIAMVHGPDGEPVNLHRTFIDAERACKADMENPRATMPGSLPDGSAVRLSLHGDRLGIAEGIETARHAEQRFGVPCWAALNSSMLAKWIPPQQVREVWIFGDNDPKFGGQAASFALAHRLSARLKLAVRVMIPDVTGTDWADACDAA